MWIEATRAAGYQYVIISQIAVVFWWHSDDFVNWLANVYDDSSAAYFVTQANLELAETARKNVA